MGIFDGHGGGSCAQVLAKRLFDYITASLLPPALIEQFHQQLEENKRPDLIESFNDKVSLIEDLANIYKQSFKEYISDLKNVSIEHLKVVLRQVAPVQIRYQAGTGT